MQIMLCDQPDRDASQGSQTIQFFISHYIRHLRKYM